MENDGVLRSDGTDGRKPGAFLPGTKRIPGAGTQRGSGRKRITHQLIAYAEKLATDQNLPVKSPLEFLIHVVLTGEDPLRGRLELKIEEKYPELDIEKRHRMADELSTVDLETRITCARYVAPYLAPKLQSVEISAENGESSLEYDRHRAKLLQRDPEVRRLIERVTARAAAGDFTADAAEEGVRE